MQEQSRKGARKDLESFQEYKWREHILNCETNMPYNLLPKPDKDTNKKGLKEGHFQALVRHKAMGMIKDKDKFTRYINTQVDNSNNNIDREEVILEKTKQF